MIGVAGEAVLDLLPDATAVLAGSPFNVALGLGRLGAPVAYLGALSLDEAGEAFLAALEAAGVATGLVQRVEQPSLRAEISILGGEARYRFAPQDTADRHFRTPDASRREALSALHVGSLSLSREPAAGVLEELAGDFAGFLSIDPNVRPAAIDEPARWRSRILRLAARADVVKLSLEDAAYLFPDRREDEVAGELFDLGAFSVLLTKAARGASWHLRGGTLEVAALSALSGDAVGAGDSFMAGLLAGLSGTPAAARGAILGCDPEAVHKALYLGAACAAITCAHLGAYAPMRGEAEALLHVLGPAECHRGTGR